ncbi:F0F1 ATP synthase subunit B [Rhodothermus bifroesti]|jgi:F-type H+-transporting ATPase subunit b|uniref:ATP synthase subunit b n=1 Tax=Rhodothermus marinus TaxID=29549 RepID=A0A7V2B1R0_RHOMR|nr:F0F1 ATP synthase subunit B [Rhodothermus bifroesti]GBD00320.1 ATP synthase subunit b [bacterium HR18]
MELILAANLVSVEPGLIFWKTITFLLLLLVLYKFAWGPIVRALQEREETIDTSLRRAERALAEARQIQAENERIRREAEQEAQRLLREAREEAERLRQEELQKTRLQIQQMQAQAQAEIEREKQGALDELRAVVADLAVQAAEKILRENLDAERQRRLVERFLASLPENQN